jgi:hypothetical protein
MTFRQLPPHYPREGGPEAAAKPDVVLQFGLAEVVQSRTVLGGALDLPSGNWTDKLGVSPELSTFRGEAVAAAYAEIGSDAFLFLEFEGRTEVWTYVPPHLPDSPTPTDGRLGRLELRRLLGARGLSDDLVIHPPMSD